MTNLGGNPEKETNLIDKKKFSSMVEYSVKRTGMTYMDAIIHQAEDYNIEMEDISKYISPVIKNKLEAEAMELNCLPRGSQLPI